jgi:hypothetical protein
VGFSKNIEYGGNQMKIVKLCREGSCCPEVKVMENTVEIGEGDNTCVLTADQWEILKEKIASKEV